MLDASEAEIVCRATSIPSTSPIVNTAATAACEMRKKRGKADDKPFLQIEWPKQNVLRQLNRLIERRDDFDLAGRPVHMRISIGFGPKDQCFPKSVERFIERTPGSI